MMMKYPPCFFLDQLALKIESKMKTKFQNQFINLAMNSNYLKNRDLCCGFSKSHFFVSARSTTIAVVNTLSKLPRLSHHTRTAVHTFALGLLPPNPCHPCRSHTCWEVCGCSLGASKWPGRPSKAIFVLRCSTAQQPHFHGHSMTITCRASSSFARHPYLIDARRSVIRQLGVISIVCVDLAPGAVY